MTKVVFILTFNQVTPRTKHASSVSSVLSEKSHEKNEHLFFIEDDRGLTPMALRGEVILAGDSKCRKSAELSHGPS